MAFPADLARAASDAFGIPEPTTRQIHRTLQPEGLIASGGRGRSAAKMGVGDVASMTYGCMWWPAPITVAPQYVAACHTLVAARVPMVDIPVNTNWDEFQECRTSKWPAEIDGALLRIPGLATLPEGHSLSAALDAVLSFLAENPAPWDGTRYTIVELHLYSPLPKARLVLECWDTESWARQRHQVAYFLPDLASLVHSSLEFEVRSMEVGTEKYPWAVGKASRRATASLRELSIIADTLNK
ncbi:hypothetical protein [Caenispirillum bisanense]|uniref:hypothetical protein n=1 Tax=Caenispirillum bisanense TaxID=414052 RepID=UPI0031CDB67B